VQSVRSAAGGQGVHDLDAAAADFKATIIGTTTPDLNPLSMSNEAWKVGGCVG
jgi:hypothetical protein